MKILTLGPLIHERRIRCLITRSFELFEKDSWKRMTRTIIFYRVKSNFTRSFKKFFILIRILDSWNCIYFKKNIYDTIVLGICCHFEIVVPLFLVEKFESKKSDHLVDMLVRRNTIPNQFVRARTRYHPLRESILRSSTSNKDEDVEFVTNRNTFPDMGRSINSAVSSSVQT